MSTYAKWKALEAKIAKRNPKLAEAHAEAHRAVLRAEHARSANRTAASEKAVKRATGERAAVRAKLVTVETAVPEKRAANKGSRR